MLEVNSRSKIKELMVPVYGDYSHSMATIKIDLPSFNVVEHRFLMSHVQVSRKQFPPRIIRIRGQKSTI